MSVSVLKWSQPRVILISDFDTDPGDAGVLAMAMAEHNNANIKLIGVIACSSNEQAAPAIRTCLDENGLTDIPVGAYMGSDGTSTSDFTLQIITRFSDSGDVRGNYPSDTALLRTLLAGAPDGTVKIVNVGFALSLENLLNSSADGISVLTGPQLLSAKVSAICMQGGDPVTPTDDWNLGNASGAAGVSASADYFFQNVPAGIQILMIDDAEPLTVLCGPPDAADPLVSPTKYAYSLWGGGINTRPAWDEMTLLAAIDGPNGTYFTPTYSDGTISVNTSTGILTWAAGPGDVTYCFPKVSDATLISHIRGLQAEVI